MKTFPVKLRRPQPGYFIASLFLFITALEVANLHSVAHAMPLVVLAVALPLLSYFLRARHPVSIGLDTQRQLALKNFSRFGKRWTEEVSLEKVTGMKVTFQNTRFPMAYLFLIRHGTPSETICLAVCDTTGGGEQLNIGSYFRDLRACLNRDFSIEDRSSH